MCQMCCTAFSLLGNGHHSSMLDVTVNDRPDTNTFAATLGRKVSTLSWSAGAMAASSVCHPTLLV